jgi:DNA-binding transcriptional ArsR family regulator
MMPSLDSAFAALADPTRRAILAQLASGEAMISDLARPFALTQPAISRHIKVLEQAGLISRRSVGTKSLCSLQAEPVSELEQWLGQLRAALEANYSRLDELLKTLEPQPESQSQPNSPPEPARPGPAPQLPTTKTKKRSIRHVPRTTHRR